MPSKKIISLSAIAFAAGILLSFAQHLPGSFSAFLFHLPFLKNNSVQQDLEKAIRGYNRVSAAFYNTAGDAMAGLDVIPASELVRRRHFKIISMLAGDGLVMVFDLDRFTMKRTEFLDQNTAVVQTEEVWAVALQNSRTRKNVFAVKGLDVQVRYLLLRKKHQKLGNDAWLVYEADVYPAGNPVPKPNIKRAL